MSLEHGVEEICDVRTRIASASSRDEVWRIVVEGIGDIVTCDVCEVVRNRDGEYVSEARSDTPDGRRERATATPIAHVPSSLVDRSGGPISIEDTTADERFDSDSAVRSVLSVPIGDHGVLQLASHTSGAFDREDRSLADLFGGYITHRLDALVGSTSRDGRGSLSADIADELLNAADVAMVALDTEGRVTFANHKARTLLGYETEDTGVLVGRDWFEMAVPDRERDDVRAAFDRVMAGDARAAESYENQVLTTGREERVIEWHNTILRNDDGEVTGTLSSGVDATARYERERELERSRRLYRTLVDQFPNGLVTLFDEDHRYELVGGTGFESLSTSADDLEGQRLEEMFPADNADRLAPLYDEAFEGVSNTVELTLDGHDFRVQILPVYDADGEVFAGMTVSQEITERKLNRQALDDARQRYQTLLEAAPDPVFVADAETGEIVEANAAAESFRDQPRDELVGLHQTDLHPAADRDAYRTLFEGHVDDGGTKRYLPDGSQIVAVTGSGEQIPVEISVSTIELGDGPVIYGVFRDISDQREYERSLTRLNEASRELLDARSPIAIGRGVRETITETLDPAAVTVYLADEDEGVLRSVAASSPTAGGRPEQSVIEPGENVAWRAFTEGDTVVFDDTHTAEAISDPDTPVHSGVVVPLGESGILVVGATDRAAFADRAVHLVELLAATATAALTRVDREADLREHERELRNRTRELEDLEEINTRIRSVAETLVEADTRREVERAVCTELVESDSIEFAWIGEHDPVDGTLVPRAQAGDGRGYLDALSLSLGDEAAVEPAIEVARTHERVLVPNTATNMASEPWRSEAVRRDFRSVASVPLLYQGTPQGVLTLYSDTQSGFSELVRSVLSELGSLIGHAIAAINRKRTLLSNRMVELDFAVRDPECFFLGFVRETETALELESVIPQSDDSSILLVRLESDESERLLEIARQTPSVDEAQLIEADDGVFIQFRFADPPLVSTLVEQGIEVRSISADTTDCRFTAAVPSTFDIRRVVETVTSLYPDSELLAKRERSDPLSPVGKLSDRVLTQLTDRQREVVEVAYRSGYFESPKGTRTADLAEKLGLSTSAFHYHVRAAERALFGTVFERS